MKGWTPERIETLKTMWVGGLTPASIAGALGGGITASAVRQKAWGLSLECRGEPKGLRSMTDEQIERLKALAAEGMTGAEIAAAFGVSRSTICGHAHRAKIMLGGGRRKSRAAAAPRENISQTPKPPRLHLVEDALIPEDNLPATDDPTGAKGCRWPVGDPKTIGTPGDDFRFCQREKSGEGGPYCEGHRARAYNGIPKMTARPVRLRRNGMAGGGR